MRWIGVSDVFDRMLVDPEDYSELVRFGWEEVRADLVSAAVRSLHAGYSLRGVVEEVLPARIGLNNFRILSTYVREV